MGYNNWNEGRKSVLICKGYDCTPKNLESITEKLLQLISQSVSQLQSKYTETSIAVLYNRVRSQVK